MPAKTKTQLKEELEEARRELSEFKNAAEAQIETLQSSERQLRVDVDKLHALIEDSERKLQEKTEQLEDAEAQIRDLQNAMKKGAQRDDPLLSFGPQAGSHTDTPTTTQEVSSVVRDVMIVRDEALEAVEQSQWELDKWRREVQQQVNEVVQSLRLTASSHESAVPRMGASSLEGVSPTLRGGSSENDKDVGAKKVVSRDTPGSDEKPLKLPPLPTFDGTSREDVDALGRWLTKLAKHAELLRWSERTKLLQFELHLGRRAERVYELLPASQKVSFEKATQALRGRLYPIESEALVSAQLMRRKQQNHERVDEFAQDLEKLFERSYGRRSGMDEASKGLLKRDVFVQGLLLKWQKKVLPSASSYSDALHQARAAEQQERQLLELHPPPTRPFFKGKPGEPKVVDPQPADPKSAPPKALNLRQKGGPPKCFECGSAAHKWRDCPLRKPTETPGKPAAASSSAITTHSESIDEKCQRLQQEWVDAEFAHMANAYDTKATVDQIVGAVGPLCYATVEIAGEKVRGMVDTGSSATVVSFELFSKIGKRANIPTTALSKPDVVLRDYNRRPIPVGAKVDLSFRYQGKSVVAPVYLRAGGHDESETCLLGTNVIFGLGLMEPAAGVCKEAESCTTTSTVCLTRSTKIPARVGTYLDVSLEEHVVEDTALVFEPDHSHSKSVGLELEDAVLSLVPRPNFFAYETDERKRKREKRAWYLLQG